MLYFQVKRIEAVDLDTDDNAAITYFIPDGLADNKFTIDENGVIRTTSRLDREETSSYTFSGGIIFP